MVLPKTQVGVAKPMFFVNFVNTNVVQRFDFSNIIIKAKMMSWQFHRSVNINEWKQYNRHFYFFFHVSMDIESTSSTVCLFMSILLYSPAKWEKERKGGSVLTRNDSYWECLSVTKRHQTTFARDHMSHVTCHTTWWDVRSIVLCGKTKQHARYHYSWLIYKSADSSKRHAYRTVTECFGT